MKLKYPMAVVTAAFVLAGCDQGKQARQTASEPSTDINAPPAQEQPEVVRPEVKAPAVATEPYPTENRDEFVASMQQKLTDFDQQLGSLSDTIASLNTDEEAQATINSLYELRAHLDSLLDELGKASPEAWDDAKMAFESSLAEFEQAYQTAKESYDG